MMTLRGKRALVVGLARSGRAAARFLCQQGATVTVTDARPPWAFQAEIPELQEARVGMEFGAHREATFLRSDLIVVSPGVPWDLPPLQAARSQNVPVIPEVELASWFLKGRLVGVTGSNGKTTTTTLLGRMLEASEFPTFVGGNIGVPLISAVEGLSAESTVVAELSSFQLEAVQTLRPHVAVLLNITPNHLDRHPSFEAYVQAKAQIFRHQTADDYAVLNADDPVVMSLVPRIRSRKVYFSRRQQLSDGLLVSDRQILYRLNNLERPILALDEIKLRGAFNTENVLAAALAACVLGVDFQAIARAAREFRGVEHRLEFVRAIEGVEFYNDSKATSVDATVQALSAFESGVHLILGGKDKGAPYAPLRELLPGRVREVLLIGAAAERIEQELAGAAGLVRAGDLETAVRAAFDRAQSGEMILLSPACASYDQFTDFEQRGQVFKQIVTRLAGERWGRASGAQKLDEGEPQTDQSAGPLSERGRRLEISDTRKAGVDAVEEVENSAASPHQPSIFEPPSSDLGLSEPPVSGRPADLGWYEVSAEEFAPLDFDADKGPGGAESETPDPGLVQLRAPDEVKGDPLLFEVVRQRTAGNQSEGPRDNRPGYEERRAEQAGIS